MPSPRESPRLEETVVKLALLAESKGVGIDDLIFVIEGGVSLTDLLRAFTEQSD